LSYSIKIVKLFSSEKCASEPPTLDNSQTSVPFSFLDDEEAVTAMRRLILLDPDRHSSFSEAKVANFEPETLQEVLAVQVDKIQAELVIIGHSLMFHQHYKTKLSRTASLSTAGRRKSSFIHAFSRKLSASTVKRMVAKK